MEKESVNEIQIICRYDKYLLTGYLSSIFKKGEKVCVVQNDSESGQYGILENIYFKMNMEETDVTYIGWNFLVKISGIDDSNFPTYGEYLKRIYK